MNHMNTRDSSAYKALIWFVTREATIRAAADDGDLLAQDMIRAFETYSDTMTESAVSDFVYQVEFARDSDLWAARS